MDKLYVANDFTLVGQLCYEPGADNVLGGAGVRLYQGVDPKKNACQFLCVQDADTVEEARFRIEGANLVPVSLVGLENLPHDPHYAQSEGPPRSPRVATGLVSLARARSRFVMPSLLPVWLVT